MKLGPLCPTMVAPEQWNVWKVKPASDKLSLDKIKEKYLLTLVLVTSV